MWVMYCTFCLTYFRSQVSKVVGYLSTSVAKHFRFNIITIYKHNYFVVRVSSRLWRTTQYMTFWGRIHTYKFWNLETTWIQIWVLAEACGQRHLQMLYISNWRSLSNVIGHVDVYLKPDVNLSRVYWCMNARRELAYPRSPLPLPVHVARSPLVFLHDEGPKIIIIYMYILYYFIFYIDSPFINARKRWFNFTCLFFINLQTFLTRQMRTNSRVSEYPYSAIFGAGCTRMKGGNLMLRFRDWCVKETNHFKIRKTILLRTKYRPKQCQFRRKTHLMVTADAYVLATCWLSWHGFVTENTNYSCRRGVHLLTATGNKSSLSVQIHRSIIEYTFSIIHLWGLACGQGVIHSGRTQFWSAVSRGHCLLFYFFLVHIRLYPLSRKSIHVLLYNL